MTFPIIRKKVLFSLEGKNISLSDLRGLSFPGLEILSVESFNGKIFNTKTTVRVDTWKVLDQSQWKTEQFVTRACLYNRLNLSDIVPIDLEIPVYSLENTLQFFKERGYDFTTDDIYIENFTVYALPTSLGYFGGLEGNSYYNSPRLVSEDRRWLITMEDNERILTQENGNGPE